MPFVAILERKFDAPDLPSDYILTRAMKDEKAAQEAVSALHKIPHMTDAPWRIVELFMPIDYFEKKYQGQKTYLNKDTIDSFLLENDQYSEKHVRNAAISIAQGMRSPQSPVTKIPPELGASIAAFFSKDREDRKEGDPDLESKAEKEIRIQDAKKRGKNK